MAKTSEHGRIIAAAAKAALAPLGCVRRGQSRIWQDDHRYWALIVEFQPSGWSKGSYLNIHVAWLWKISHGYPFSYRAGAFVPFENVAQFLTPITELTQIAAVEIHKIRERFKSFADILDYISTQAERKPDFWPTFDAAIAFGLSGDIAISRRYFNQAVTLSTSQSIWQSQARDSCLRFSELLNSPRDYREAVCANIAQRRRLMRLPPDLHCLDELGSKVGP